MTKRIAWLVVAGLSILCLAAFTGSAQAGGGGGNDGHGDKAGPSQAQGHDQKGDQAKSGDHAQKDTQQSDQSPQAKQDEQQQNQNDHKITICHATGSATNPYVEITVDKHALKNGHTTAKGDIIPAPAGGCPTTAPAEAQQQSKESEQSVQMVSFCDMESATSGKLDSKPADKVFSHELNGTPEEARDIVPPFSYNGQTYSQLWDANGQAIFNNHCEVAAAVAGQKQGESEEQDQGESAEQEQGESAEQEQSEAAEQEQGESAEQEQGESAEQQGVSAAQEQSHKVTICHATGSATNPYVEITVDRHALKHGHTTAKGDIIPAPATGCPAAQASNTAAAETPANAAPANNAPAATPPATAASNAQAATPPAVAASNAQAATPAVVAAGEAKPAKAGVLAAQATRVKPTHGLLGAAASKLGRIATRGTLPFTGLPLWVVVFAALVLLAGGLVARGGTARR